MNNLNERVRQIDIEKLTVEEADRISAQIGEKVREICDKAVTDANRILNIYGMEAKMQIAIGKLGELTKQAEKPKRQRKPRKKKDA